MHRLTFALATAAMLTLAGATPTGAEVPADFPTRPVTLLKWVRRPGRLLTLECSTSARELISAAQCPRPQLKT